jgi:hypothetical protein
MGCVVFVGHSFVPFFQFNPSEKHVLVFYITPRSQESQHCGIFQESLRTELWFETEQHAPLQLFRNRREEPSPDEPQKRRRKVAVIQ